MRSKISFLTCRYWAWCAKKYIILLKSSLNSWLRFHLFLWRTLNNFQLQFSSFFNVFYVKKYKTYPAYVSKYNSNRENQVILLMIPNGEGCHYLAVKKLSALLREITSKNNGHFYCLNCLHSFRTKDKLELHKQYVKLIIFVM